MVYKCSIFAKTIFRKMVCEKITFQKYWNIFNLFNVLCRYREIQPPCPTPFCNSPPSYHSFSLPPFKDDSKNIYLHEAHRMISYGKNIIVKKYITCWRLGSATHRQLCVRLKLKTSFVSTRFSFIVAQGFTQMSLIHLYTKYLKYELKTCPSKGKSHHF